MLDWGRYKKLWFLFVYLLRGDDENKLIGEKCVKINFP